MLSTLGNCGSGPVLKATVVCRYGSELRRTVDMLETHDLGHSVYRSLVRLLQTGLQVTHSQAVLLLVNKDEA